METKPNEPALNQDELEQLAKFLDALLEVDMTNKSNERNKRNEKNILSRSIDSSLQFKPIIRGRFQTKRSGRLASGFAFFAHSLPLPCRFIYLAPTVDTLHNHLSKFTPVSVSYVLLQVIPPIFIF